MIELDGVEYQVQDTGTIASQMIEYINNYCQEHNITNTQGDIIYIEANRANPLYMIIWGLSFLLSIIQRLIYNVGCAFDIAASSPRQLLNLADIAKTKRNDATYTIIPCVIYALDDVDCLITKDLVVQTNVAGQSVNFHPAYEITVKKGQVLNMPLIADVTGPLTIEGGWATQFMSPVEGLDHIVLSNSIPGAAQETIADLRARMQRKRENYTQIDAAKQSIMELPGVASCSIYFNYSYADDSEVGGIMVPPRKALVIIQGYNDNIAQSYYEHLLCESVAGPTDRTTQQDYVTHANQHIPMYFIMPETIILKVDITIDKNITYDMYNAIKDKICEISLYINIGDSVTSFQVMEKASQTPNIDVNIIGCTLGAGDILGLIQVVPNATQLITISPESITIRLPDGSIINDNVEEDGE